MLFTKCLKFLIFNWKYDSEKYGKKGKKIMALILLSIHPFPEILKEIVSWYNATKESTIHVCVQKP